MTLCIMNFWNLLKGSVAEVIVTGTRMLEQRSGWAVAVAGFSWGQVGLERSAYKSKRPDRPSAWWRLPFTKVNECPAREIENCALEVALFMVFLRHRGCVFWCSVGHRSCAIPPATEVVLFWCSSRHRSCAILVPGRFFDFWHLSVGPG